jgi:uncharacterized lipoprotein YmbA
MANKVAKIFTVITLILASGCAAPPSTHFYLVEALTQPSPSAPAEIQKKRLLGVGPLAIPTFLDRQQIVTRTEHNTVRIAEFHQWASPLKDNVMEVLRHNLEVLQPNDIMRSYPWSAFGGVDYHIVIDITRFDTYPGQSANFEANWAIRNDKTQALVTNGQSRIEQKLTDTSYAATVHALSQILDEFSHELSLALQQLR